MVTASSVVGLLATVAIAGVLVLGLLGRFPGAWWMEYVIGESEMTIRMFGGLVTVLRVQYDDIQKIESVRGFERVTRSFSFGALSNLSMANRFSWTIVRIERRSGFFQSITISPRNPDEFAMRVRRMLSS